jgi:hypothetical protein
MRKKKVEYHWFRRSKYVVTTFISNKKVCKLTENSMLTLYSTLYTRGCLNLSREELRDV